jgi:hypothetical protein
MRILACAEDTSARQNASKLAFALAYAYFGMRRRYFRSTKCKQACFCPRLCVFWHAPKILPLGKMQASLLLPSLMRIFVSRFVRTALRSAECRGQVCAKTDMKR